MKIDYYTPFYTNQYYHIYNRGNNGEKIFYLPDNYIFFLKKFSEYLSGEVETYSYCLIPNHFHFIVKVINKDIISEKFKNFFLGYSKAINKQEGRTGSLFQKRFKRTIIEDRFSLVRAILYLHTNPVHHNICNDFVNYPYSSYKSILSKKETKLCRVEVLELFDSRNNYTQLHQKRSDEFSSEKFYIEHD